MSDPCRRAHVEGVERVSARGSWLLFASVTMFLATACRSEEQTIAGRPTVATLAIQPPTVLPVGTHVDSLFGVPIADPFRWMEDSTRSELPDWLRAQREYTDSVFARLVGRDTLAAQVTRIFEDTPTLGEVFDVPGRRFLTRYLGPSASLMMIDGAGSAERLLLGDSALAGARNGARLRAVVPSWNGEYVAIGSTARGDADAAVHVMDVARGVLQKEWIPDLLTTTSGTRYQVTWLPDGSCFIYPRHWPGSKQGPAGQRLARGRQFLHRMGTPQSSDVPIFGFEVSREVSFAPEDLPTRVHTAVGATWVVGSVFRSKQNGSDHYAAPLLDALKGKAAWVHIAGVDDHMGSLELHGDTVYAISRRGADRGTIVRKVLSAGLRPLTSWDAVVAEQRGVITGFAVAVDGVYFTERDSGAVVLRRADSGVRTIAVPRLGSVKLSRRGGHRGGALFAVDSWAVPPQWFEVAASSARAERLVIDDGVGAETGSTIAFDRLEVPSTDGARVPVSVVYDVSKRPRGERDGTAPLLIEAYGAFGTSTDPQFSPRVLAWVAQGGVYAYAHVRGGGENGDAWHRAATREGKQRSIDDMIAAIEALIAQRYTGIGRVVITGTSFGANIPGLVMLQRPDLLAAVEYEVGQPDEIRGAAFDPTAARNLAEIGDIDSPAGVRLLQKWSPYHQIPDSIHLPAIIVHSADDDYNFGSSMLIAKFVARLQAANRGRRPVIWVRTPGGHSELFYLSPAYASATMSFTLWQAGDARFQPH